MNKAIEIEKRILGITFFKKEYISIIIDSLETKNFSDSRNKIIFAAISEIHKAKQEVDLPIVLSYLEGRSQLNIAGGEVYLIEIQENFFDVKSIDILYSYIREVKKNTALTRINKVISVTPELLKRHSVYDTAKILVTGLDSISSDISFHENVTLKSGVKTMSDWINEKQNDKVSIVKTYYPNLDEIFTGLNPKTMTVIGAKTGAGKTSFAINLLFNNAAQGKKGIIFSYEMSTREIVSKLTSMISFNANENKNDAVTLQQINSYGKLDVATFDKVVNQLGLLYSSEFPILIKEITSQSSSIFDLVNLVRYYKNLHKVEFVIIDYMQLIEYPSKNISNRTQALGFISRKLKLLASELDIPIIVLAQLSREADKVEKPRRFHLRESGSIEHDADNIILLHSKEQEEYNPDIAVEVIIEKQRAGRIGSTNLIFKREYSLFIEENMPWRN